MHSGSGVMVGETEEGVTLQGGPGCPEMSCVVVGSTEVGMTVGQVFSGDIVGPVWW